MTAPQLPLSVVDPATERREQQLRQAGKATLQDRVKQVLERLNKTQADLARELNVSKAVISSWLSGKYEHNSPIPDAIRSWLIRTLRDDTELIDLKNTRRIMDACTFAASQQRMALIIGRPGYGKTVALRAWYTQALKSGQTVIYHFTSPMIRPSSLCKMMARRLELSEKGTGFDILERVAQRLKREPATLLFDEANHFNLKCLEIVRYLWDQCTAPIVLCGSLALRDTVYERSQSNHELAQLQSRVAVRVDLEPLSRPELKRVVLTHFAEAELGPQPGDVIEAFRRHSGMVIRNLTNLCDTARGVMRVNALQELSGHVVDTAAKRLVVSAGGK